MQKIVKLSPETIVFDDESIIYSVHEQDCCESHYIDPTGLNLSEIMDLEFDLSKPLETLIERVEGYGIRLKPVNNFPLSIPAYGINNGYYGTNIKLILQTKDKYEIIDITECQEISDV